MSRRTNYFHHSLSFYVFFVILIFAVLVLISTDVIGITFEAVGFTPLTIAFTLVACLIGSSINIPLYKIEATVPMVREEYVRWLGVTYRVPKASYGEASTQVSVNVGGALIPTSLSVFLLSISSVSIVS